MTDIPEEWIEDYLNRSGDDCISAGTILVHPDKGFVVYNTTDDTLILVNVYGDGKFWDSYAQVKARELGLSKITFGTRRNPDTFIRRHQYKIIGYILEKKV